jgi:hypothetical protein
MVIVHTNPFRSPALLTHKGSCVIGGNGGIFPGIYLETCARELCDVGMCLIGMRISELGIIDYQDLTSIEKNYFSLSHQAKGTLGRLSTSFDLVCPREI